MSSDNMQKSMQVLDIDNWTPSENKFMPYKKNDRGGGSINVISSQINKALRIQTPLMMTWGIGDFFDEKTGESDGRYKLQLNFPNEEYATDQTTSLLEKVKEFEEMLLNAATENSATWFGKKLTRELVEDRFFSTIKWRKNKETKEVEYDKPPAIQVRVPCYEGNWGITLYDYDGAKMFPSSDPEVGPLDLVPKYSQIACIIQCGGLWFGGKGWGYTWKLNQAVIKPKSGSTFNNDECMITVSNEEKEKMKSYEVESDEVVPEAKPKVVETQVEDSDGDEEEVVRPPTPPVEEKPKKKVVKKKVATASA